MIKLSIIEFLTRFAYFLFLASLITFFCFALQTYFAPVSVSLMFTLIVWLAGALVGTLVTYIPKFNLDKNKKLSLAKL